MKFEMGERVNCILQQGKFEGEVVGYEIFERLNNGVHMEEIRYRVAFANNTSFWLTEQYLEKLEIVLEHEDKVNKLLIDICLKFGKFEVIPSLLEREE